ncbi:UDP-glucuronosyltransferase 2B1-like [Ooceraea biroi]|uniref:UDP-glucuronosyltransferase 2B1-like n=1 Tax=Ooceraea biroi TaxID=2015173 RepID=UPI000F073218|nr:UDP-glucuronosyltransferase 2B1-like [Ooceraea biroi]
MSRWSVFPFFLVIALMTTSTASLSILLIESFMTTSHHIWAMTLVKGLLQEGHRVHVMSIHEANIEDNLAQNLTYAIFEDVMKEIRETSGHNFIEWMDFSVFYMIYFEYSWGINTCEKIIQTKAAKELLEMIKHHEFDVIVQDITLHQCLYGLWQVAKAKTPIVGFIPFGPAPWLKEYTDCPNYPNMRPYGYAAVMRPANLWQRTLNVLYYIIDDFIRHYYFLPASQRLAEQYVGHKIKPLRELEKTIRIVLINSHFTFDNGIPLPPNAIEVGGMHAQVQSVIGVDASHYESMSKFLDEAENGVIVISLGTNVDWKHIGLNKLRAVVLALSKLKQQVLWKLNIDVPVKMPDNVMAVKWLPQNDVLNHKNVKAIWSHGGLLSLQEAIWKGIPVVGMPFILEQRYEMEKLIAKGAGIRLDFNTLSMQSILNALEEIVYNKSYTENMKRLSNEYRDRSLPPLDLAIWSIEYVVRNPNGNLASPIRSQSWMEKNLIDVYAILFFALVVKLLFDFFVLKMLYNYFCKSTPSKSRKDKQM